VQLVITDSGLGGLSVCAEVERRLRGPRQPRDVRITYVNAWPAEGIGYNDLPDSASRAGMFDRALASIDRLQPDRVLVACNTLSILYGLTVHSRTTSIPVLGIVDAGVNLFHAALEAESASSLVMFGTRITIDSGVHRARLIEKGIDPRRITAVSCHGLALAIETNPDGPAVRDLIETCTARACEADPAGNPLCLGLCCTHYTYVREDMRSVLARQSGRTVHVLDPNDRLVTDLLSRMETARAGATGGAVTVTVMSKVKLDDDKRRTMAKRIEPVSALTAAALLSYTRVPDLF